MNANTTFQAVRSAILGWEKLRLMFNFLLLLLGLILSWDLQSHFGGGHVYAFWVAVYGLTANAFYCLGPLIEIYLLILAPSCSLRSRTPLFIGGTLFSLLVTSVLALSTRMQFVAHSVTHGM